MPLSESKSLLKRGTRKCNSPAAFHILPHDPAADLYAIQKLADDLDTFSPIVGLQQETAHPDCAFLDVTGLAHLFGDESNLAEEIQTHCRELGYLPKVAIAHTVGLAQGKAQFECSPQDAPGLSRANFGMGSSDDDQALPVAALRLSDWITQTLGQLGVLTIGQLLQLPRQDLSARFGDEIYRRLDQFTGKLAEPIIARQQAPEFFAEQLLEYPTSHQETIEVIIERLIASICQQLTGKQQGALQWTVRLYNQHRLPLKLYISLFQPTAAVEDVIGLARMQLEQVLQPNARKNSRNARNAKSKKRKTHVRLDGQALQINEISVTVTSCVLLKHRQRKLFDENPRLDRQSLAHLINRLSGRLGRQQVVYPTIVAGAQPEHAYQFRPLVDPHRKQRRRTATKTATGKASHVLARPLHLLQPPVEIQTVARAAPAIRLFKKSNCVFWEVQAPADTRNRNVSAGASNSPSPFLSKPSSPALLMLEGQRQQLVDFWGPERIETGWWRGRTVRRDYWRVETETHQQFWIYRDLRSRKWFLQGKF